MANRHKQRDPVRQAVIDNARAAYLEDLGCGRELPISTYVRRSMDGIIAAAGLDLGGDGKSDFSIREAMRLWDGNDRQRTPEAERDGRFFDGWSASDQLVNQLAQEVRMSIPPRLRRTPKYLAKNH